MTKLPSNVIQFAAGDNSLFEEFVDYWNHFRSERGTRKYNFAAVDANGKPITLFEKEQLLNQHLIREISKRSGVDFTSMPLEQACTHPLVAWSAGLLVSQLIDAILPDTLIDSIGAYSEIRVLGYGETGVFDINSRDLFPVSRAGRLGMREAEVHKGFQGQVTLNPEYRTMTVGVAMFRVLTGQESLANFTIKALRSIETAMTKDIYDSFAAALLALSTNATTGLRVTGYAQSDLVKLAQKVSAFSGGAAPILLGTKVALSQVFPDDANYRYTLEDTQVTLGYIRNISGINTFEMNQVANWESPFSTYLADDKLYIVAPGTDKLVKCVIGGAMISNTTGPFDTATLTQSTTMTKAWRAGVVTSSVAACITL